MENRKEHKGIYKNIKYKAVMEYDRKILHVLDMSGNDAYRSVTNGVELLIPYLENVFKIDRKQQFIICYGTDGIVSRLNPYNYRFQYLQPSMAYLDHDLYFEMNNLYGIIPRW